MATIKLSDWEAPEELAKIINEDIFMSKGKVIVTDFSKIENYDYSVHDKMELSLEQSVALMKMKQMYEIDGDEKTFQRCFVANLMDICKGLNLSPPKYSYEQKRMDAENFSIITDVIVLHRDNTVTIFEMKKAPVNCRFTNPVNQMNGIGQCLLYKNVWEGIVDGAVRVAIVDEKIYYRTFCALSAYKIPITLIEFQYDHIFVPYNGW